jgi:hypothetical protein
MGVQLGKTPYMGGQLGKPSYMGGPPEKPPYMGGPYSFFILPKPGYSPTGVPMPYDYHLYPQVKKQLPFLATLDLPDLPHLTNDPI